MGKIKVMHVLASNRFSGAENVICQIIELFKEKKEYEMVYVSPDGEIRDTLKKKGVPALFLKELSYSEVKRVIKEWEPSVIHAHDMHATVVVACAAKGIRVISHIHNNNFDQRSFNLKSLIYQFFSRRLTHVFWVSESALQGYYFNKSIQRKSSVLRNVISESSILERVNEDETEYQYDIIFLGRLSYLKNPQRALQVCKQVSERFPKLRVAFVGTGEMADEVKTCASSLKLNEIIDFLGHRNNPYKVLKNSKLLLMTSRTEGTPMCLLEAMALGVPVVSTPVGGICEIIVNAESGYLCEEDEEMVQSILTLLENAEIRNKMSAAVYNRFKEINAIDKYRDELEQKYMLAMEER